MNLQESIRKILREEISNSVNSVLRRLHEVDWLVEFSVREIQRQYNGICNVGTSENFVETVIEKTGDGMYWDFFADTIDDGSEEWSQDGEFTDTVTIPDFSQAINNYLENCTGDTDGFCSSPLKLHSDSPGLIKISGINVNYREKECQAHSCKIHL